MSRIHQLNQTIYDLRLRGLSERQELRELRKIVSDQKNALDAAQAEIAVLVEQCAALRAYQQQINDHHRKRMALYLDGECFDARQYESLSIARTQLKSVGSYSLKTQEPPCLDR